MKYVYYSAICALLYRGMMHLLRPGKPSPQGPLELSFAKRNSGSAMYTLRGSQSNGYITADRVVKPAYLVVCFRVRCACHTRTPPTARVLLIDHIMIQLWSYKIHQARSSSWTCLLSLTQVGVTIRCCFLIAA